MAAHDNSYPVFGFSNGLLQVEDEAGEFFSASPYKAGMSWDYLATLGIEVVAGRGFRQELSSDPEESILINEAAVQAFGWGSPQAALGKRLGYQEKYQTVVGVVKDFHFESLHNALQPTVFRIYPKERFNGIVVRYTPNEWSSVREYFTQVWQEQVPHVPLDYSFMEDDLQRQYIIEDRFQVLFIWLSVVSALIACMGLFGLAIYAAQQRLKELGIRKTLGASTAQLLRLVGQEFLLLVGLAALLSIPLIWWMMDAWLGTFAYAITFPWLAPVGAALLSALFALATIFSQAYKAARVNPSFLLHSE